MLFFPIGLCVCVFVSIALQTRKAVETAVTSSWKKDSPQDNTHDVAFWLFFGWGGLFAFVSSLGHPRNGDAEKECQPYVGSYRLASETAGRPTYTSYPPFASLFARSLLRAF